MSIQAGIQAKKIHCKDLAEHVSSYHTINCSSFRFKLHNNYHFQAEPSAVEQQVLASPAPDNIIALTNQDNTHSAHKGPDNSVNCNKGEQNAFNKENNPAPVAIADAASVNQEEAAINEERIENVDPVNAAIVEPQIISTVCIYYTFIAKLPFSLKYFFKCHKTLILRAQKHT